MFKQELRDAVTVKRWGIVRTLKDQDIAQHSFFVAHYVNDICTFLGLDPEEKLYALQMAIWHDVRDEIFTGDIAGPAKRKLIQDRDAFDTQLESWADKTFGKLPIRDCVRNDMVHVILKVADELDQVFELITESRMGNQYAEFHIELAKNRMYSWLGKLQAHISEDELSQLNLHINSAIHSHRHDMPLGPIAAL